MTTVDAAYLAIIDDLEARIVELEAEVSARVAGQRADHERHEALRAAAWAIVPAARHGVDESYVKTQADTYQTAYDTLLTLLKEDV